MKPLKPPSSAPARARKPTVAKALPVAEILDFVLARIESHPMVIGEGLEVRKDRQGYSLYLIEENEAIARLRPVENRQRFELLHWSDSSGGWRPIEARKKSIMALDEALDFIDDDPLDCFWL